MSLLRPSLNQEIADPEAKISLNLEMFSAIAREYDFMTRTLSFGQDAVWKQRLVERLPDWSTPSCVDLACGTGDLAFLLAERYPQGQVVGIDLTPEMVQIAQDRNAHDHARFEVGNMECLADIASTTVDIVTGGYAIRNAPDVQTSLQETHRILRSGGIAAFLDFSRSPNPVLSAGGYLTMKAWGNL